MIICPVCAGNKTALYDSYEFSSIHAEETFHLVKCQACGIIFTDPHPGPELLNKVYCNGNYYAYQPFYLPPETGRVGLGARVKRLAKSAVLDHYYGYGYRREDFKSNKMLWLAGRLMKNLVREDVVAMGRIVDFTKNGKHLDIGCGSGYYIWWMEKHGWQSQGIEISAGAVESARKVGLNVSKTNLPDAKIPDSSFDTVTAWEVIEHLPGLIDQLKTIHRILKPGGRLVGSVPNAESWEAKLFGKNWQPWEIPSHLYHFAPDSLMVIFKQTGFRLEKLEFLTITHSWDASLDKRWPQGAWYLSLLRALGHVYYALSNATGHGARIRFVVIKQK